LHRETWQAKRDEDVAEAANEPELIVQVIGGSGGAAASSSRAAARPFDRDNAALYAFRQNFARLLDIDLGL
jgi:hypothetical protein